VSYNNEYYVSLIGEIFDGYSVSEFAGKEIFIKHINIRDQRYLHKYYEFYKNRALSKGIESRDVAIKRIIDDELWLEEDDLKISSLEKEVKNLENTKKALYLPSKIKSFQKTIDEKFQKLHELKTKRSELIGVTAEGYAENRAGDEMLRFCLFKDKECKEDFFSKEEFDELEFYEVQELSHLISESSERLNEDNIKHAVLRPFFSLYLSNCENLKDFYGRAVVELSANQLKVAMYAKVFHSIFQFVEDIPDNIKEDPDLLLDYSESKRGGNSSNKPKIKDDAAASAVFGATKEDMEYINKEDGETSLSLSDEIKKSGGKLDMKQMMRLAGHDV